MYDEATDQVQKETDATQRMVQGSIKDFNQSKITNGLESHKNRAKKGAKSRDAKLGLMLNRRKNHQNFIRSMHKIMSRNGGIGLLD